MDNLFLKIYSETEKIVKIKYLTTLVIILGIVAVIWLIFVPIKFNNSKKDFSEICINSLVIDIENYPRERYFLLDSVWYNIKTEISDVIQVGDSIIKDRDSSSLKIIDNRNNKVKYYGEPKVVSFTKVKNPKP